MSIAEVTLTQTVRASRRATWDAVVDPRDLAGWWGPRGFTCTSARIDPTPGGAISITMVASDGTPNPIEGEVLDVEPESRLRFRTIAFFDERAEPGLESETEIRFDDAPDGTTLVTVQATLTRLRPGLEGARDGMEQGWRETLERLAEHVEDETLKMRHDV